MFLLVWAVRIAGVIGLGGSATLVGLLNDYATSVHIVIINAQIELEHILDGLLTAAATAASTSRITVAVNHRLAWLLLN